MVVTPAKNLWHCFGCAIGGGPIDWVIKKTECPSATRWNSCATAFLLSPIREREPPGLVR
ncbi:MAG: hypothetical protein K8F27_05140 [Sulfuricellaceae bacterium]|nr:hypothetical protein [Sulfuricellaceae bacterium]